MMSASTAPPRNTACFRRGGSSIRILNFCACRQRALRAYAHTTHVQALWVAVEDASEVQLLHLLLEPRREARVHAAPAGEDDVLIELGADVDGGGLDRLEEHLRYARLLDVDEVRLEHALRRLITLRTDLDRAPVG
jgi:hypothetical protein